MERKNYEMPAKHREMMIARIEKIVKEVDNQKLQEIYFFVSHIQ